MRRHLRVLLDKLLGGLPTHGMKDTLFAVLAVLLFCSIVPSQTGCAADMPDAVAPVVIPQTIFSPQYMAVSG